MSKVLVVCYSRGGTTHAAATELAVRLHADFEAITEPVDRSGAAGCVRAMLDTLFARDVALNPLQRDVAAYEIVVIGTPVWAGRVSAPVRAWLAANRRRLPHVAFLCTQHMRGDAGAFREMAQLAGKQPVARCALTAAHGAKDQRRVMDTFVERIERKLARIDNLEWAV
ncbi:flavodoxin family protein [Caballeronia cordobensis]|uniref:flavodoxin family protein n=1 Tax=Caballeronia cordobensis TaxID=1353886 RepID=UPI00045EF1B8|nr:uncharacterized protein BRPE67_DCDS11870 [Burkholderia sp. RPE67]